MFDALATWIENHEHTVDLLKWLSVGVVAWASGLFSMLGRYKRGARLEIPETASLVFCEFGKHPENGLDTVRASFILNTALVNATNEKIVADQFLLSFKTIGLWRSHRQKLLRFAFPSRPRKQIGEGLKYMGVWFTEYPADELKMETASGSLEPKETCSGYLLFSSYTFGKWNPKIENDRIQTRLKLKLTSQTCLSRTVRLRVTSDRDFVEAFSPGFCAHVAQESTWNHDLSVVPR
jgi:hypothetical protein